MCFVQTAALYTSGKYLNWNFKNLYYRPTLAMENFQSHLWERTLGVQVKSGVYIDSHLERCVLVQTAKLYNSGKYLNWNLKICPICNVWEIAI